MKPEDIKKLPTRETDALLESVTHPYPESPTSRYFKHMRSLEQQRDALMMALGHILWIKDCGIDGTDETGTFRNFPESEHEGLSLPISEWARRYGIRQNTLTRRLQKMPLSEALRQPISIRQMKEGK